MSSRCARTNRPSAPWPRRSELHRKMLTPPKSTTISKSVAARYRAGDADKLARIVNDRLNAAPEKPDRLLIYVDQWEELYAMAPAADDTERLRQHSADVEKFIELLIAATSDSRSRARVVLTVRADFYTRLIRSPLITALLPSQQVNIRPMQSSDLRSAIETPANKAGLSFAPPGTGRSDFERRRVGRGPIAVASVCTEGDVGKAGGGSAHRRGLYRGRWSHRSDRKNSAGCLRPAYAGAAGRGAAPLPASRHARRGAGRYAGAHRHSRRRSATRYNQSLRQSEDKALGDWISRVCKELGAAGSDMRATVEVAHEALIQRWPTLRSWINDNRENLRAPGLDPPLQDGLGGEQPERQLPSRSRRSARARPGFACKPR